MIMASRLLHLFFLLFLFVSLFLFLLVCLFVCFIPSVWRESETSLASGISLLPVLYGLHVTKFIC